MASRNARWGRDALPAADYAVGQVRRTGGEGVEDARHDLLVPAAIARERASCSRLSLLSEEALETLQVASILGVSFSVAGPGGRHWPAAAGARPDPDRALEAMDSAGRGRETGGGGRRAV